MWLKIEWSCARSLHYVTVSCMEEGNGMCCLKNGAFLHRNIHLPTKNTARAEYVRVRLFAIKFIYVHVHITVYAKCSIIAYFCIFWSKLNHFLSTLQFQFSKNKYSVSDIKYYLQIGSCTTSLSGGRHSPMLVKRHSEMLMNEQSAAMVTTIIFYSSRLSLSRDNGLLFQLLRYREIIRLVYPWRDDKVK